MNPAPHPFPDRPDDTHKGSFGTVMVIGGCPSMPGAPALAARAALRAGCGLVKIATTADTLPQSLAHLSSATGVVLPEDADKALLAIHQADPDKKAVLAVGPGWGQADWQFHLLAMLQRCRRTLVVDADALNLLAQSDIQPFQCPAVLTPHPGEMRRLSDMLPPLRVNRGEEAIALHQLNTDQARALEARHLAACAHAVTLLKGSRSVVATPDQGVDPAWSLEGAANPALATAGTGDVLTGLIASLIAQGMPPAEAARQGAWTHAKAGQLWSEQHGNRGLLAPELADLIPAAMV